MALISNLKTPDDQSFGIRAGAIPFAAVDSTSTSTAFTATVPGITELADGTTVMLKNGVVTSATNFTININGLGAKPCYTNLAAATRDTTIFNINYTMIFVYDSTRVSGGGWICYRGYDANTNTIGYQIRTNSFSLPMDSIVYRYRLLFQSADNTKWVPATNSTSTNATAARTVCQSKINPFGAIVYYGTTASVAAGSRPSVSNLWQQYTLNLGYSFQKSPNYVLTEWKPVYLKCAPQTDGSAIIDADVPFVQDLPSTEDGKIYILLGYAYSTTAMELVYYHPVYHYKDGMIRLYTTAQTGGAVNSVNGQTGTVVLDAEDVGALPDDTVIPSKTSDLTNDSGFITSAQAPVQSVNGNTGAVTITVPTKTSDLTNDTGYTTLITVLESAATSMVLAVSDPTGTTSSCALIFPNGNPVTLTALLGHETTQGKVFILEPLDAGNTIFRVYNFEAGNMNGPVVMSCETDGYRYEAVLTDSGNGLGGTWTKTQIVTPSDIPTKTSDLTNDSGFVTSDTKVTQTVTTTTDYTYWRGLCVGSSSSQAETGSLSTTTDQVRIFSNIRVQPSTGTLKATTFKGQLSGTIASSTTATTQASTDNSTKVATTAFVKSVLPAGLPSVSSSDNGKVLTVVNGAWAAASLPVYNGGVI